MICFKHWFVLNIKTETDSECQCWVVWKKKKTLKGLSRKDWVDPRKATVIQTLDQIDYRSEEVQSVAHTHWTSFNADAYKWVGL